MADPDHQFETIATRFDESRTVSSTTGDVVSPIHLTTTHEMDRPGTSDHGYKYTRFGNPTRDVLEARLARLAGADRAIACASGTAAMAATCLAILDPGDPVVASDGIYGGTRLLFEDLLRPSGRTRGPLSRAGVPSTARAR